MEHLIAARLLEKRVEIHLVGVGGNGAQMAACLARLDLAMKALGHPDGLHVTAFDGDRVSEANVGRQLYSPADVGQFKAVVTVHRLNQFYGLDWIARPYRYERFGSDGRYNRSPDLIVSCVDTRSARRAIHERLFDGDGRDCYWLDLGNTEVTGQVVLGESAPSPRGHNAAAGPRLPCVTELFPELLDASVADDDRPSCSMRTSLASQGLFINDVTVRFGAQMLYELFSNGRICHHGALINLDSKRCAPIDVDPLAWRRFGFESSGDEVEPVADLPQAA